MDADMKKFLDLMSEIIRDEKELVTSICIMPIKEEIKKKLFMIDNKASFFSSILSSLLAIDCISFIKISSCIFNTDIYLIRFLHLYIEVSNANTIII